MNVFRAALSSDIWITGIAIARYSLGPFVQSKSMGISFSRRRSGRSIGDVSRV